MKKILLHVISMFAVALALAGCYGPGGQMQMPQQASFQMQPQQQYAQPQPVIVQYAPQPQQQQPQQQYAPAPQPQYVQYAPQPQYAPVMYAPQAAPVPVVAPQAAPVAPAPQAAPQSLSAPMVAASFSPQQVQPKYIGTQAGCQLFEMELDNGPVTMAKCKGTDGPVFMQVSAANVANLREAKRNKLILDEPEQQVQQVDTRKVSTVVAGNIDPPMSSKPTVSAFNGILDNVGDAQYRPR